MSKFWCIHAKLKVAFFDPSNFRAVSSRSPGPTMLYHSKTDRVWWQSSHAPGNSRSRASLGPDEIDEDTFVVVLQVGQVVGEVGEVVANTDLQVLADVTIDCSQRATATLTDIREVEHS